MPSRATGFTDMQTRVSALAADTSTQLMDIYGRSKILATKNLLEDTDGLRQCLLGGATQSVSALSMR